MTDFLLELLSEEIPARMQAKARADLERLFTAQLAEAGLKSESITTYSTPRRLALIAHGLPDQTQAVHDEVKGPPEGAPDQAVDGFCRKNGVSRDQLEVREVKGRATYFAVINTPGRATSDVLAEAIPAIIHAFPWPKSMRWGKASISTESLRWVRPLQGIIALFGSDVVACEVDGIKADRVTVGHRFHYGASPASLVEGLADMIPLERIAASSSTHSDIPLITINSADDYAESLRGGHVIVDHEERQNIIRDGAAKAAADAGLVLVEDEGLVIENAGLTEWPVPLLGRYDEAFLDVPEEVIQLTARVNQKYFICRYTPRNGAGDHAQHGGGAQAANTAPENNPSPNPSRKREGKLAPAFVCTANIDASDGGKAVVAGNEKVLAARLADAKFFWELDQKTPLAVHAEKLKDIVFHEKLGTVADKVERVAKLARWLCEEGIVSSPLPFRGGAGGGGVPQAQRPEDSPHPNPSPEGEGLSSAQLATLAEQAARLCKADLVTEMVGEFPELQGLMGGYYAEKEGLDPQVAAAIRDHYKPVGQGDDVPTAPVTVAVSLADKLDTLVTFFAIDEKPTGSKDPFALRRASLGVLRLLESGGLRISLSPLIERVFGGLCEWPDNYRELSYTTFDVDDGSVTNFSSKSITLEQLPEHKSVILELRYGAEETGRRAMEGLSTSQRAKILPLITVQSETVEFLADRLKVQQREAGVRHDLIDAVFALGQETNEREDDLVRLLARVKALQGFVETEDGANLLAGYKRAANILKKETPNDVTPAKAGVQGDKEPVAQDALDSRLRGNDSDMGLDALSYTPEPAEAALISALTEAKPAAAKAVEEERFEDAMTALASLRAPIDAFFDTVTVNDENADKRAARLALLADIRNTIHTVADFSKIEG
ncbi:glycine--tRNA ligase subunit beta [Alterisphingorhabdus coralli]|uniref:Glycine--tRNA ligase beta subunit n=1 Tax=Alterisphingorhabdus coralli TaxID=3071408 RepID=A0AA97I170_9SPHN|nr:glycine--tRNA ligase subunit beta [Parasphingorhabdus sp. SCSIO 66989]WOE76429.1 glycine--tRNA ligase subunit beta [Parasphingorhabdus sp. SCSIO 66989]